jgi:hypothetical protein
MAEESKKSAQADERVKRGPRRADPDLDARSAIEDDREEVVLASDGDDEDSIDDFIESFAKESLPKLPQDPSWHYCWLTTTNQRDPIHGRLRVGYVLVKLDEVPHMTGFNLMSGEFAGHVGINEMVLAKIPAKRYQKIMEVFHHKRPREEEAAIKARVQALEADMIRRRGAGVATVQGFDFERREKAPVFE